MSEKITIKSEKRNIYLNFLNRPKVSVRNDLRDFGYISIDSMDREWKLDGFEINHQMVFASFDYLKEKNFELLIDSALNKQLGNIVKKSEISNLLEIGKTIKETHYDDQHPIPGFKRVLKPYQIMPVMHINGLTSVANFSVPGSGKTTIVLAGYSLLKKQDIVRKILVIGPYSSLMPWEEETKACFKDPPSIIRIHGPNRHKIYLNPRKYDIFLITYHSAYIDIDYLVDLVNTDKFLVVLDESHYIKNIDGKISSTILRLNTYASARIILTGTPIPNKINDIYSQITFLYPESILGAKAKFKHTMKSHVDPDSVVRDKINPIFTRITKDQMNLPDPFEEIIKIQMSDIQKTLYRLVSERIKNIIETEAGLTSLDQINNYKKCKFVRLRQIASNVNLLVKKSWEYGLESLNREISNKSEPKTDKQILEVLNNLDSYLENECSPKLIEAVKLVEKLEEKGIKKILIWSDFIINLSTLYNYFSEKYGQTAVFLIVGDTPKASAEDIRTGNYTEESREFIISKFKEDPEEFNILVANPQACAESISLHRVCHNAIYVDRSFNCGQFIQSKDRIHRIGLDPDTKTIYYYLLSVSDNLNRLSIDEVIHNRLMEKEERMLEILNDINRFDGSFDPSEEDDEDIFDEI